MAKIFVERDLLPRLSSDLVDNTGRNEQKQADSSRMSFDNSSGQGRLRSSMIPLLKDIRRTVEVQMDSSEASTPRYKNVEFHPELDTALSSPSSPPPPPPPPLSTKGPSPYATTYLTTKPRNEHELPYIDDSISSGSISGRTTSTTVVQQSEKPKITLASTNIFFRRSHDV